MYKCRSAYYVEKTRHRHVDVVPSGIRTCKFTLGRICARSYRIWQGRSFDVDISSSFPASQISMPTSGVSVEMARWQSGSSCLKTGYIPNGYQSPVFCCLRLHQMCTEDNNSTLNHSLRKQSAATLAP